MDFGEILTKAWHITWKHKILWLFGILASCGTNTRGLNNDGGNSGPNVEYQFSSEELQDVPLPPLVRAFLIQIQEQLGQVSTEQWFMIGLALLCLSTILGVLFLVLRTAGKIGLIQGALQADQGVATLTFGGLFETIKPFFWRVLGLNLLLALVFFIMGGAIAVFTVLFVAITFGLGALCLLPLICLAVPVGWLVGVTVEQANIALVSEDLDILTALQRGWDVVRANIVNMILLSLVLILGVGVLAGGLLALPFTLIVAPVLFNVLAGNQDALANSMMMTLGCFVLYLPVLIVAQGILQTYVTSAWTLTFRRLTTPNQGFPEEALEPA